MSDVKRYYVGINTKCLGGIGLVEMNDLYREATGFDVLVMGKDYDAIKAENESLRADAERFRHLMFNHVDWYRNGKDDDAVMLKFGPYPSHKLRETIDGAISSPESL